jgi:hypothetical protein
MNRFLPSIIMISANTTASSNEVKQFDYANDSGVCRFARTQIYYKLEDAVDDARRSFYEDVYYIYGVANGISAEYVGLESQNAICPVFKFSIDSRMLWVGADYGLCKDKSKITEFALTYSQVVNTEMIRLLKEKMSTEP